MKKAERIGNEASVLRRKLTGASGRRGASAVLALGVLLICIFVAGIILTGASANLSRSTSNRSSEKASLAISSAVGVFEHDIASGAVFTGTETVEGTSDTKTASLSGAGDAKGIIATEVENAAKNVYDPTGTYTQKDILLKASSGGDLASAVPDVTVRMSMDALYNITAVFSCTSDGTTTTETYVFSSQTKESQSHEGPVTAPTKTITTTTVSWSAPTIVKGE